MEKLINKKYRQYDTISRYAQFPIYYNTYDNKWVTATTAYLKNTTNYQLYKVQYGDTYDKLALEFYGNPSLYWVICSFNKIQDPFVEPVEGDTIAIPTLSDIQYDL